MLHLLAADTTRNIPLDVSWVAMIEALIIPLLVALVTKSTASSAVKGFATVLLSAIAAVATVYVDTGGSAPAVDLVGTFFVIVLGAHTSYKVVWSPAGATDAVQKAVPAGFG